MASIAEAFNASSTAFPDAIHATIASAKQTGLVGKVMDNATYFNVFLTVFVAAVIYDQRESILRSGTLHNGH